jgi:flagellar motor protein MotB
MAGEVQPIIIKKIQAGHGGAHGGAWKVAYADFVTAMMCFFLVMWLMGADEATKAAVADYFNNPTSAWRKDLSSAETMPLGDRTGAGENLLKGADGATPEDLVQRPQRPYSSPETDGDKVATILDQFMTDESIVKLDQIRFSMPESLLFVEGSDKEFHPKAQDLLDKIGRVTRKYKGKLEIQATHAPGMSDSYEFQMSRVVSIQRYIVDHNWSPEDRISTLVLERRNALPAGAQRKIEFTLTKAPDER